MPVLIGLPGIKRRKMPCVFVFDAAEVETFLSAELALTAAGPSGAINVWVDDAGMYRCKAMRNRATIDSQQYQNIDQVKSWVELWLNEIK